MSGRGVEETKGEAAQKRVGGGRPWVALVVSLCIGGALLWVAVRDLEFDEIIQYIADMDGRRLTAALAGYAVLYSVVHVMRMWRWSFLLRHLGDFPLTRVMSAAAIGFTAIIVLPLRLGELVRPYVLARETDCTMSAALGSAVVERVIDGLFISLLLFVTLALYEGDANTAFARGAAGVSLSIFVSALTVVLAALWRREWTLGWLRWLLSRISHRLEGMVIGLLESFLDGAESLRKGRTLVPFVLVTAAYWGLNGLSIAWLGWAGFGLALGPLSGLTVLAILVVGLMIPTGPGLAGNYELFALEALGLFLPQTQVVVAGAAFVAAMHLVQFFVQLVPGLALVWARGTSLFSVAQAARHDAQHAVEGLEGGPTVVDGR